ncbi:hypothetical protein NDI85_03215 [Halomicroarcula sp. S1AR25-4]|uniref:HTH domain-containing protein n=1 Tax=Haloarcula sp. S1AR25-4 TaxID=2950538 RepID=UPI002875C137|nr:HTH domain-containing protein [Halomicroarcula sp. S1AR25-4]MDS0276789.1 hypothetical protein [Halomicroarcula sp. S1AR25-4]
MSSGESALPLEELLPSREVTLSAEVFVHSLAPVGSKQQQDALVERLSGLVEEGLLEELDLLVWGDSICTGSLLASIGSGKRIVSTIGEFYALAAKRGISISPFFRISKVTSSFADESFRRIVPPCRCLALYAERELVAVFPCLIDGVAYTPEDAVAALERTRESSMSSRALADESI